MGGFEVFLLQALCWGLPLSVWGVGGGRAPHSGIGPHVSECGVCVPWAPPDSTASGRTILPVQISSWRPGLFGGVGRGGWCK